jgi:predicted RNase H-like HicB family nuclease
MEYNSLEVIEMARAFPVVIERDDTGYFVASCPILEGCYTQGKTLDEAMENIKEAISLCLKDMKEEEIPKTHSIIIGQVVV